MLSSYIPSIIIKCICVFSQNFHIACLSLPSGMQQCYVSSEWELRNKLISLPQRPKFLWILDRIDPFKRIPRDLWRLKLLRNPFIAAKTHASRKRCRPLVQFWIVLPENWKNKKDYISPLWWYSFLIFVVVVMCVLFILDFFFLNFSLKNIRLYLKSVFLSSHSNIIK